MAVCGSSWCARLFRPLRRDLSVSASVGVVCRHPPLRPLPGSGRVAAPYRGCRRCAPRPPGDSLTSLPGCPAGAVLPNSMCLRIQGSWIVFSNGQRPKAAASRAHSKTLRDSSRPRACHGRFRARPSWLKMASQTLQKPRSSSKFGRRGRASPPGCHVGMPSRRQPPAPCSPPGHVPGQILT